MDDEYKTHKSPTRQAYEARMYDCMLWVAKEARAIVMSGVQLPHGSRLREALAALATANDMES